MIQRVHGRNASKQAGAETRHAQHDRNCSAHNPNKIICELGKLPEGEHILAAPAVMKWRRGP